MRCVLYNPAFEIAEGGDLYEMRGEMGAAAGLPTCLECHV
jgi:hypothetical protein